MQVPETAPVDGYGVLVWNGQFTFVPLVTGEEYGTVVLISMESQSLRVSVESSSTAAVRVDDAPLLDFLIAA